MDKMLQQKLENAIAISLEVLQHAVREQLQHAGLDPNLISISVTELELRDKVLAILRHSRRFDKLQIAVHERRLLIAEPLGDRMDIEQLRHFLDKL